MAKDKVGNRFEKRQRASKLRGLSHRARSVEDVEAEEEAIAKAEKVEPIKAESRVKRNDPCPCGSGKKYKKCCGASE